MRILVRARELACRNTWGDDLWEATSSRTTTSMQHRPGAPLQIASEADDAVTSVVDAGTRASRPPSSGEAADDRVTHTAVRHDMGANPNRPVDDFNAAANDDQTDRVRIMARGSRDAILRARERAAQRRHVPRPTIEPAPGEDDVPGETPPPQDDEVFPIAASEPSPTVSRMTSYQRTPPVPREEVDARNRVVSPAIGPDERFDSIPAIKADVELPRLRQFLNHRGPEPRATSHPLPSDVASSSYDHVLQRAREIKSSAGTGLNPMPRQATQPQPEPEPTPEAGPPETHAMDASGVVWDLEVARRDVAFTRVRSVLDEGEPTRATSRRRGRETVQAVQEDLNTIPADDHAIEMLDDSRDDEFVIDVEPEVVPAPSPRRPVESPRASWWRSLNFGKRRRVTVDRYDDLPWEPDEFAHDDGLVAAEPVAAYEPERYLAEPDAGDLDDTEDFYAEDDWAVEDETYDDQAEWDDLEIAAGPLDEPWDDEDDILVTSESSWREDVERFPEPQPPTWHEERVALLANSPFASVDTPLPPVPAISRSPERRVEQPRREETPRRERRSYAIDQPGGLSAVREALFGNDVSPEFDQPAAWEPRDEPAAPPAYREPRRAPRQVAEIARPEPTFRESLPAPRRREPQRPPVELPEPPEEARQFTVSANVRKCCLTCRSFQPAGDGGQGRCGNAWSHTHKQLVQAEDLPCHSSIGDWWLADDLAWIPPETMIRPATPNTDRLQMERVAQNEPSARDGQRVRTRKVV